MKDEHEQSKRSWLNIPNILIAVVLLFLLVVLVWNQNISEKILSPQEEELIAATITPTPAVEQSIPSEFYSEPSDTSGIIFGSIILLVIIFGSSLWKLRSIKK